MNNMKPELLEYLIRHCVKEVIRQKKLTENEHQENEEESDAICSGCNGSGEGKADGTKCCDCKGSGSSKVCRGKKKKEQETELDEVDDETIGSPAPPESGQGTADTPEIPKNKNSTPESPSDPKTPPENLKGIILVNPRDKAKLKKVVLSPGDDAKIERALHLLNTREAGSNVKTSISSMRLVKDALRNPNSSLYLYFGKYDSASDEIFLMADKSLQVAKDSSVPPTELSVTSVPTYAATDISSPENYDEFPDKFAQQTPAYSDRARSVETDIDENLKDIIKKMVNEVLDTK